MQFWQTTLKLFCTTRFLKSHVNKTICQGQISNWLCRTLSINQNIFKLMKRKIYCIKRFLKLFTLTFHISQKIFTSWYKKKYTIAAILIKHIDRYCKTEEKIRLTWHLDNSDLFDSFVNNIKLNGKIEPNILKVNMITYTRKFRIFLNIICIPFTF